MAFNLMYEHQFEIAIEPGDGTTEPTFAPLAAGINNVEPANNEELAQDNYLDGDGFGETDVIGAQLVLTFSGHRDFEDEAQNYIFENMLELGESRRTEFRWTNPVGTTIEGNATIANISGPSGDAGAKGEISFEMHFNGKPERTEDGAS